MNPRRYLCSHMVTLRCGAVSMIVNLEEISESGAVLECEEEPPQGRLAEMRCETATFCGHLKKIEAHEFGWRVEMEFSPLTPWSPERFQPSHLLDPSDLGA